MKNRHEPVTLPSKQVLVPGIFVDSENKPFEIREDEVAMFLAGTLDLIRNGYRILGWPQHGDNDITNILSRWGGFELVEDRYWSPMEGAWKTGPTIRAVPVAENAEAAETIRKNDTSPILVWDYPWAGRVFPRAIIRLDHVGQGAVPTESFRIAASASKASRYATRKVSTMPDALIQAVRDIMESGGAQADAFRGAAGAFFQAPDDDSIIEALAARLMAPEPGGIAEPDEGDELPPAPPTEDGVAAQAEDEGVNELDDAIEEEMLMEEEPAPPVAPASVAAGAAAGYRDPRVDSLYNDALNQTIRAASRLTMAGCGAPLSPKTIAAARRDFAEFRGPLGEASALRLVKRSLAAAVKVAKLSGGRAQVNVRAAGAATGSIQPQKRKAAPARLKVKDVTGANNPLRSGVRKHTAANPWE